MNKYLRTHGKKIMAIMGILLMIAFALPSATQMGRQGPANAGTMYNGAVTLNHKEYSRLLNEWHYLKQQQLQPRFGQFIPFVLGIGNRPAQNDPLIGERLNWGRLIQNEIDNNEELFPILVKEAQRLGIAPSNDTVNELMLQLGYSRDADPVAFDTMWQPIYDLMTVAAAADRADSVVKVSQPVIETVKATRMQEVAVNVLEYDAKDYLAQVPAPAPEQIQAHFNKYKDVEADASPNGFGYKYPNRVKYEAVLIKKDDVRKGIAPVELDQVYEYYLRNKNAPEFITTTAPSTKPEDAFTLDRGPTTRAKTFEETKETITKKLTDQRVEELTEKIREAVATAMKADYTAYAAAIAAKKPAPPSYLGVPYDSKDYLAKLRDKTQADHKVTLTIEREEGWQTPKTLEDSKLGKDAFATETGVSFPRLLTSRIDPFMNAEQKKAADARAESHSIAVWEPTPVLRNERDNLLIARVTAADPAHVPASIDEVKDKVAADVKQAAAYEKAKAAAQAALDAAKSGKWLQSVANEQNKKMISTGLFGTPRTRTPTVPGYDALKGTAVNTFTAETLKLLTQAQRPGGNAPRPAAPATTRAATNPTTAPIISTAFRDHPIGLVELPAEGKVDVVEIDQLKPLWTKDVEARRNAEIGSYWRAEAERDIRLEWFRYDNVVDRTGYKLPEGRERKTPRQNVPINPFTGMVTPLVSR